MTGDTPLDLHLLHISHSLLAGPWIDNKQKASTFLKAFLVVTCSVPLECANLPGYLGEAGSARRGLVLTIQLFPGDRCHTHPRWSTQVHRGREGIPSAWKGWAPAAGKSPGASTERYICLPIWNQALMKTCCHAGGSQYSAAICPWADLYTSVLPRPKSKLEVFIWAIRKQAPLWYWLPLCNAWNIWF